MSVDCKYLNDPYCSNLNKGKLYCEGKTCKLLNGISCKDDKLVESVYCDFMAKTPIKEIASKYDVSVVQISKLIKKYLTK